LTKFNYTVRIDKTEPI